jgi:hypothetical protein
MWLPWIPICIHPIFRRNLKRGDFLVVDKGTGFQYIASNDLSNSLWRPGYTVRNHNRRGRVSFPVECMPIDDCGGKVLKIISPGRKSMTSVMAINNSGILKSIKLVLSSCTTWSFFFNWRRTLWGSGMTSTGTRRLSGRNVL